MKKKGFTLIELLAVIIVIAVIAIITVPTILGVIDKSKKAAYKDSVYGIIESAKIYLAMNQENIKPTEEIEFVCNGIACSRETNGDKLSFKGTVPKSGSIYLQTDGSVLVESVYNGKYYANNETGEVVITEADTTLTRGELTKIVKELKDENSNLKDRIANLESKTTSIDNKVNQLQSTTTSIDKVYPVGSIYISTSNVNPGTLFKGTEWEIYAEDKTLLGVNKSKESGQTGGTSNITLEVANLPSHRHTYTPSGTVTSTFTGTAVNTTKGGGHNHSFSGGAIMWNTNSAPGGGGYTRNSNATYGDFLTGTIGDGGEHQHAVTAAGTVTSTFKGTQSNTGYTGSGSEINIMNPYITVYMWKRIS